MHGELVVFAQLLDDFSSSRKASHLIFFSNLPLAIEHLKKTEKKERAKKTKMRGKKLMHAALIKLIYANEASYNNKLIWS